MASRATFVCTQKSLVPSPGAALGLRKHKHRSRRRSRSKSVQQPATAVVPTPARRWPGGHCLSGRPSSQPISTASHPPTPPTPSPRLPPSFLPLASQLDLVGGGPPLPILPYNWVSSANGGCLGRWRSAHGGGTPKRRSRRRPRGACQPVVPRWTGGDPHPVGSRQAPRQFSCFKPLVLPSLPLARRDDGRSPPPTIYGPCWPPEVRCMRGDKG